MVGLFGIFRKSSVAPEENERILKMMLNASQPMPGNIVNRFFDKNIALGRVGLGVLNRDTQPATDKERRYSLFMDGQIFDYEGIKKQLEDEGIRFSRNSEEEVVLKLFIRHGKDVVKYLKGVFLVIIYDSKKERICIFNSRYGQEYFYYYVGPKEIIFASSLKALLAAGIAPKVINKEAIYDFLRFDFITGDDTFFAEIKLFPYASILEADKNGHRFERYWDYPKYMAGNEGATVTNSLIEEGSFLLNQAITRHLKKDIRPAVTLSGGLDSRTISAYLTRAGKGLKAFHVSGNHMDPETLSARAVCDALGGEWNFSDLNNIEVGKIISEGMDLSDGHVSANQFWLLDCVKNISERGDINYVLDGFVTDILFQPLFIQENKKASYSLEEMTKIIIGGFAVENDDFIRAFFRNSFCVNFFESTAGRVKKIIKNFDSKNASAATQFFHFTNRARRFVLGMPIVNRSFIEYGFPGLDYDLLNFGLSLPLKLRLKGELYRRIILKDFPELGRIPWPLTGLPLDQYETSIMKRRKIIEKYRYYASRITNGGIEAVPRYDLNRRFRKEFRTRNFFISLLKDERTVSRGHIDRAGIEKLIQHQDSGRNYMSAIQTLVTIELMYRNLIDDRVTVPNGDWSLRSAEGAEAISRAGLLRHFVARNDGCG